MTPDDLRENLLTVDCTIALIIFFQTARLAGPVAVKNWQRTCDV
jgi:hypothetical protein